MLPADEREAVYNNARLLVKEFDSETQQTPAVTVRGKPNHNIK